MRQVHETTSWTTSVCTGALLWPPPDCSTGCRRPPTGSRATLAELGADPVPDRVVEQGKIITAAGVSSGIDMALASSRRSTATRSSQAVQLGIEYDPAPPFDAGSPEKAPKEIVELVTAELRGAESPACPRRPR